MAKAGRPLLDLLCQDFCIALFSLFLIIHQGYTVKASGVVFPEEEKNPPCLTPAGERGICRSIYECPSVLERLQQSRPTTCGFDVGDVPIICCPRSAPPGNGGLSGSLRDISPPELNFECGSTFPRRVDDRTERLAMVKREYDRFTELGYEITRVERNRGGEITYFEWSNGTYSWMYPDFFDAIGGEPARYELVKYMALLGWQEASGVTWFCDGVLINEDWILTAAHCLQRRYPDVVRLDEYDYKNDSDLVYPVDYTITRVVFHPDYKHPEVYHDLALMKLNETIRYERTDANPVCLPWGKNRVTNHVGTKVTLTGWGATEFGGRGSSILQEVNVTVFDPSVCDRTYSTLADYSRRFPQGIDERIMCAGDPEGGKDACSADSGGPLVYRDDQDRFTVAGIVSTGYGCGHRDFPGIYIPLHLPSYLAWIKNVAF